MRLHGLFKQTQRSTHEYFFAQKKISILPMSIHFSTMKTTRFCLCGTYAKRKGGRKRQ